MTNFDVVNSDIEIISDKVSTLDTLSVLKEQMLADYKTLSDEQAAKILEQFISNSNKVTFSIDENWEVKMFNTDKVFWYVVCSKETHKNVWTIRYFKNVGNVIYTPNYSKQSSRLWRITSKWVQRIKALQED